MPPSCPNAHQWLRLTLHQWLRSTVRLASRPQPHLARPRPRFRSTTSSINHGLRAEVDNESHRSSNQRPAFARGKHAPIGKQDSFGNPAFENEKQYALPEFVGSDLIGGGGGVVRRRTMISRQSQAGRHEVQRFRRYQGMDHPPRQRPVREQEAAMYKQAQIEYELNTSSISKHDTPLGKPRLNHSSDLHAAKLRFDRDRSRAASLSTPRQDRTSFRKHNAVHRKSTNVSIRTHNATHQEPTTVSHSPSSNTDPTSESYKDLLHLTRTLQQAEQSSDPDSRGLRDKSQSQLGELIDRLNDEVPAVGKKKAILREVLGPHTTIESASDKIGDYSWTTHRYPPKDMPRSIIWLSQGAGEVLLISPEIKVVGPNKEVEYGQSDKTTLESALEEVETGHKRPGLVSKGRALQKLRDLLGRCRYHLVLVQQKEKSGDLTLQQQRELLNNQQAMVEVVDKANALVAIDTIDLELFRFAVKRELGQKFGLWSSTQPEGNKTVLWFKEDQNQLLVIGKDSSPSENEPLEAGQKKRPTQNKPVVAHDTHIEVPERRSKQDRGPAWEEVNNWMKSQARSPETQDSSRRRSTDARTKPIRDEMPISVPYTTAASSFLYGANAILACLSAKKRIFYHLYFAGSEADEAFGDTTKDQIQKLAREADIPTTYDTSKQLLDKMSERRPHNGVALEASQIPAPPVLGLGKPDMHHSIMPVQLDRQNPEDIMVNGAPTALPLITKTWRHPFILMLDGILDEGNLGNIMRTAYFYGVDAVAVSKNTCASVNSPIVAKASSGAIEAVQILSLPQPSNFIYNSLRNSWRVYAAVAPPAVIPSSDTGKYVTHTDVASRSPLQDHACILMLGAEGEGLRGNLRARSDYFVTIEQGERAGMAGGLLPGIGVDSMNVSSAAGVLVESFMRKPQDAQILRAGSALGF